jgi:DNA-binding response OmpR family regulator
MRILLIEDEPAIADFIERGLRAEGYSVELATDGVDGERRAIEGDCDLVLLDLMLPRRPGVEVLRAIRRVDPILPVILLTALGQVDDKVVGLDAGATDYLTKPFSFDELTARIRAHLRVPHGTEPTVLAAAGIEADLVSRTVVRDGQAMQLSAKEFDLLVYFMRRPDVVVSREQILREVWGYEFEPGTNIVQVYVGYLRRKLDGSGRAAPIETVRSAGYRLRANG